MMTTLRNSVKEPSDMEKTSGRSFFDKALIPFIPEDKDVRLEEGGYIQLTLKVNREGTASAANTMTKKVKIFDQGDLEELLLWKRDVEDILIHKPTTNGVTKFEMVESLLKGDPLNTWRDIRRGECDTVPVGGSAPGPDSFLPIILP